MSINRWDGKEGMIHVYNIILLSHIKNKRMLFAATWMQLEIVILIKVSQKEKDETPHGITYTWNLKYSTNEPIYKTERDSLTREQTVVAKGEEGWGGKVSEFGISRCKLLYIVWRNNKVLLYSTSNYIQYPMINYNK